MDASSPLTGIDEEGVTDLELDSRMRSIEGALRGLPEGSCLYQYTRVMSGFDLPRQAKYANPITEVFASDRLEFPEPDCSVPPHRSSLVPHAGAIESQSVRAQAPRERHRHIADVVRP